MNIFKKSQKGFTLVELLVVMAIIGVLASLGVASFRTAQVRGRDTQRKSDLKQVANSFELYYADYGKYPDTSEIVWGSEFKDVRGTVYFKVLPVDPLSSESYSYMIPDSPTNQKYKLFANLENLEDQDCIDGNCALTPYNFAVTSANTSATE